MCFNVHGSYGKPIFCIRYDVLQQLSAESIFHSISKVQEAFMNKNKALTEADPGFCIGEQGSI